MSNSASAMAFSNSLDDSHSANASETPTGGHPSKSVDEIMPLLNQASITSTSLDEDGLGADESDNNEGPVTAKGRSHQSSRKAHGNRSESENSQSGERGMMSFSRKKLKSKYMKSKAAKAGIVLDGANGQITNAANAASDSEK